MKFAVYVEGKAEMLFVADRKKLTVSCYMRCTKYSRNRYDLKELIPDFISPLWNLKLG